MSYADAVQLQSGYNKERSQIKVDKSKDLKIIFNGNLDYGNVRKLLVELNLFNKVKATQEFGNTVLVLMFKERQVMLDAAIKIEEAKDEYKIRHSLVVQPENVYVKFKGVHPSISESDFITLVGRSFMKPIRVTWKKDPLGFPTNSRIAEFERKSFWEKPLGSYVNICGDEVYVTYKGITPTCKLCKKRGHKQGACTDHVESTRPYILRKGVSNHDDTNQEKQLSAAHQLIESSNIAATAVNVQESTPKKTTTQRSFNQRMLRSSLHHLINHEALDSFEAAKRNRTSDGSSLSISPKKINRENTSDLTASMSFNAGAGRTSVVSRQISNVEQTLSNEKSQHPTEDGIQEKPTDDMPGKEIEGQQEEEVEEQEEEEEVEEQQEEEVEEQQEEEVKEQQNRGAGEQNDGNNGSSPSQSTPP